MLAVTRVTMAGGLFLAGICVGWLLHAPSFVIGEKAGAEAAGSTETEREEIGFRGLTSPYLECAGVRDRDGDLAQARRRAEDLLDRRRGSDPTLEVSVYARDLLNGPWVGIDEDRGYEPASLMKVWVLFHALARMEQDPDLRDREYVYPGPEAMPSPDNLSDRPPEERMVPGGSYRYEDLVERMIVHSDNHAKDLVMSEVTPGEVENFLEALGMEVVLYEGRPAMNPRSYSALFRILFNSSIFSRPTSEWALDLMTRGRYQEALRASVPPGVLVASKFGIHRATNGPDPGSQLHECEIVYAARGPYVLCVMTRSRTANTEELAGLVAEIGRIFFQARAH